MAPIRAKLRRWGGTIVAMRPSFWPLLAYALLTVLLGAPVIRTLDAAVASDLGDPLLNTWILWWISQRLPLTTSWWNGPAFFPAPDSLALSEHLLGLAPFATPIIWLTGNAVLAYNITFLLTFLFSAIAAYGLGLALTQSRRAAFVTGLLYAFAPYRMSQLPHIQVLASFWMPAALAGLHTYVETRRGWWLVLFGVATLLQGLSNGYYLLFFPVLLGLWVLWFVPPGNRPVILAAMGGAFVVAALPLVPLLLHYREVHQRWGLRRSLEEAAVYSARITDLASGMPELWLWGPWLRHPGPEAALFPGLAAILLIVGAWVWARREPPAAGDGRGYLPGGVRVGLAIIAALFSMAALHVLIVGPLRLEVAGLRISARELSKPLTQALWAWLVVAVSGPTARRSIRSRSALTFYAGATVAMWILALGPTPSIGNAEILYAAPYRWLAQLPGFDGLRVPGRFAMLATLCLSAAGGLALARLQARVRRPGQSILVALVALGVIAEGWRSVPAEPVPEPSLVTARDIAGAVMELPLDDTASDVFAQYRGIGHGHPVVNGYSGYSPPHYHVLKHALAHRDTSVFDSLAALGVRHVVVLHDRDRSGEWQDYVASHPGARLLKRSANQSHYLLSAAAPERPAPAGGAPLRIARVVASVQEKRVAELTDGDLGTRWSTGGPQMPGQQLVVDLGAMRLVTGVELWLGGFAIDFPRRLLVEASPDQREWTALWEGGTGGLALAGALEDPRRKPVGLTLSAVEARYLRLTQRGRDRQLYWSVAELIVVGREIPR